MFFVYLATSHEVFEGTGEGGSANFMHLHLLLRVTSAVAFPLFNYGIIV